MCVCVFLLRAPLARSPHCTSFILKAVIVAQGEICQVPTRSWKLLLQTIWVSNPRPELLAGKAMHLP